MTTTRVSTGSNGSQSTGGGSTPMFSPDGSSVVFDGGADLAPGGDNGDDQVVIKDLATGALTLVSSSAAGVEANAPGPYFPVYSPDGTGVAFESTATNLSPAGTNGNDQIYLKTLGTGAVTLVSSTPGGAQGNGGNFTPTFSPTGTFVAFDTNSTNLGVTGGLQVAIKNLANGTVSIVSTSASGAQANSSVDNFRTAISPDGTQVAFSSTSSNLVAGDTAGTDQIFIKNIGTGAISIASTSATGALGNGASIRPVFSPDGTQIAFESSSSNLTSGSGTNLTSIFVKNLSTGAVTLVSTAADGTAAEGTDAAFSPDGTSISFESGATNIVPGASTGATNIYVKNLTTGVVTLASQTYGGGPANGSSFDPAFAPNSSQVAFDSGASNLVPNDTNGTSDVFVASPVCYRSGSRIRIVRAATVDDVAVEGLQIGDVVLTASGAHRSIRWLGHRTIDCRNHPRQDVVMPVRISAHAFGHDRPARDLYVSPGHAICVDVLGEVLIPAIALANGSTVQQVEVDEVTYWHVELESHDVILAENLPAESYLDMGNRGFFNEAGVVDLDAVPDVDLANRTHADFYRPYHAAGPLVDAVKMQLAKRAEAQGWTLTRDLDLHLEVDGLRVDPVVRGLTARFQVPAEAKDVWLVSPTARPCDTLGLGDRRDLGLCIGALRIDDGFESRDTAIDDPLLDIGFYEAQEDARRWTSGRAHLPPALWQRCEDSFYLRINLAGPPVPRWIAPMAGEAALGPTFANVA